MKWPIALAVAGIAAGTAAARRKSPAPDRWLGVTVNLPPDEVENDPRLREAFAELAEDAETRVRPAPGGRGTELAARPRQPASGVVGRLAGRDPRQPVRSALRDVKSLLETGEVIRTDAPTTGRPTPGGMLVRLATRRAGGEGRL
ncbi:hypothetical protein [Amycolatopsis sp. MtRt-6]|uniref:hypothetical protein n=1 Tax=Amycolatopsis sp. MtRt-6 TaxID=2792782 RepID=UPI001A8D2BB7|nr:hypothetical protein [Amycolatopsis sp. MtRt-6]